MGGVGLGPEGPGVAGLAQAVIPEAVGSPSRTQGRLELFHVIRKASYRRGPVLGVSCRN